LEALAAAAAAEPSGIARSIAIATASGGVVALAAANIVAPAGAPSVAGLTETSLEAAAALVSAALAVRAAPPGLAGGNIGSSSSVAAGKARKPHRPLPQQRLSYILKHRFTTFVVHL
jgi:hypothetical protein